MPEAEVTTHGHYIQSFRNDTGFKPHIAYAEFFDNAIDAGATIIQLTLGDDAVRIVDDGSGADDLKVFFDLGATKAPVARERLGRYGTGGTKAAASLCDVERVTSTQHGVRRTAQIEWTRITNNNLPLRYTYEPPAPTRSPNGTALDLIGILPRARLKSARLKSALEYWSKVYVPALRAGLIIQVNGERLAPRPFPLIKSERIVEGTIGEKRYVATVGILANESQASKQGWQAGFYVATAGRLIWDRPQWDEADDYAGAPVWAYIQLEDSQRWSLDTHKGDLVDREELFSDFVPKIQDLLESAHEQGRDIEFRTLEENFTDLLAQALGVHSALRRIKEKRNPPINQTGTVDPSETGRKRERATKTTEADGSVIQFPSPRSERVKIIFKHYDGQIGIGRATLTSRAACMEFDADCAAVKENRRNWTWVISIALSCLWNASDERSQQWLWDMVCRDRTMLEVGNRADLMPTWLASALGAIVERRGIDIEQRRAP